MLHQKVFSYNIQLLVTTRQVKSLQINI